MKPLRLIVPFAALLLIAAACTEDEGGGDGATPATEENTGNMNVLSAGRPYGGGGLQRHP